MKVEIEGVEVRDFRMDPTGRFPVDPTLESAQDLFWEILTRD